MARKRAPKVQEAPAVPAKETKAQMAVRLELPAADYQRIERQARRLGLTKASYARMAVMKALASDEDDQARGR